MSDLLKQSPEAGPVPDRRRIARILIAVSLGFFLLSLLVFCSIKAVGSSRIRKLEEALDTGDISAAERILSRLERADDTEDYYLRCSFLAASMELENGNYLEAASAFAALGNYPGAEEQRMECLYREASRRLTEERYAEAEALFEEISSYSDAASLADKARYERASAEERNGDRILAFRLFLRLGNYADSVERAEKLAFSICGEANIDAALAAIEGLSAEELAHRSLLLQKREQVRAGTLAVGFYHTVGLREDGTVVACGDNSFGQCDIAGWHGIKTVAAGAYHTLGLQEDGTVLATGRGDENQCDVSSWSGIVAVAAADYASFGLRDDGTVVACGYNDYYTIPGWTHVTKICGGTYNAAALTESGDALVTHITGASDVLTGLVDLAVTTAFTAGLKADGTLVCSSGADLSDWKDIVSISAGSTSLLGLDSSGRIRSFFFRAGDAVDFSRIENCTALSAGGTHFAFLLDDGTVTVLGENKYGECETQDWDLF